MQNNFRCFGTKLFLAVVASAISYSCVSPEVDMPPRELDLEEEAVSLTSSLEQPLVTKLKLSPSGNDDDGYPLVWEEGDRIAIVGYNPSQGTSIRKEFTLSSEKGSSHGTFTGTLPAGCPVMYAVYPYPYNEAKVADGSLSFKVLKDKSFYNNNIASNLLPSVSRVNLEADGEHSNIELRNVFGLIRFTLTSGTSVKVKRVILHDLGGNQLWGTCQIPISPDGELDYENLSLSGGDNSLTMDLVTARDIGSQPMTCYFSVPPGSLDRGFSVAIYEEDKSQPDGVGRVFSFLQKTSGNVPVVRSQIYALSPANVVEKSEPADELARGFYKALFIDGGTHLNGYYTPEQIPFLAEEAMDNEFEYFVSTGRTDTQSQLLVETDGTDTKDDLAYTDANGVLLYPDGEPRFRAVFVNGGSSKSHGQDLGQEGRSRFHDFFNNGGSLVGACAGAILAASSVDGTNVYDNADETKNYSFGMWPGNVTHTGWPTDFDNVEAVYTAIKVLPAMASLDPGNELADNEKIEDVRHHGGVYFGMSQVNAYEGGARLADYAYSYPHEGSSIADSLRFNPDNVGKYPFNTGDYSGYCAVMSYKNGNSGRAVLSGSHFEKSSDMKQYAFFRTMLDHAFSGNGTAEVKADLQMGEVRNMDKSTEDAAPAYTKIGDRQYHHFRLVVEEDIDDFVLELGSAYDSKSGIDLYLGLRRDGLAWMSDADYILTNKGGKKTLQIKRLPAGTWYVSVYCATTVSTVQKGSTFHYLKYAGKTEVLDGIAYRLTASVDGYGSTEEEESM